MPSHIDSDILLNYLKDCGNVDIAALERECMMKRKDQLVQQKHKYKIQQNKDGRWRTTVKKEDGKLKYIVKTKKSDLIDVLYIFYTGEDNPDAITFGAMFKKFRNYKEQIVSDNTIWKYDADYKRFFNGTDFSVALISNISPEDCEIFIIKRIKDLKLNKRAYESLWGYMNGTFRMAKNKRFVDENPMESLSRRDYMRHCFIKRVDPSTRIVSNDEFNAIMGRIHSDHINKPDFITGYAVELASLTGMRVGEISALMWDCVDFENKVITIDKAEVFHQKDKVYTIEGTKNGEVRFIPITEAIEKLLKTVHDVEEKFGFLCEFVFANMNGQIHKIAITDCARNKSMQVGVSVKPVHSYRRTINSRMKSNGVCTETAAAILGHTVEVNNGNYSYDVTDMAFKRDALDKAKIGF